MWAFGKVEVEALSYIVFRGDRDTKSNHVEILESNLRPLGKHNSMALEEIQLKFSGTIGHRLSSALRIHNL